jgi:hypothetical protein
MVQISYDLAKLKTKKGGHTIHPLGLRHWLNYSVAAVQPYRASDGHLYPLLFDQSGHDFSVPQLFIGQSVKFFKLREHAFLLVILKRSGLVRYRFFHFAADFLIYLIIDIKSISAKKEGHAKKRGILFFTQYAII